MTDRPSVPSDLPPVLPICEIQGRGLVSPHAGERVRVGGVVTGTIRKGFFVQDPTGTGRPERSDGIFCFRPGARPPVGHRVEVLGKVLDYRAEEEDRPSTQIAVRRWEVVEGAEPEGVEPVWLRPGELPQEPGELASFLNALEGMLVGLEAGSTLIAPSNPFGDYVVLPRGAREALRTDHGGVRIDPENPDRWFPGFRIEDYDLAPVVDVGAVLREAVVGPLNYRSAAFQMATPGPIRIEPPKIEAEETSLESSARRLTVLTLNGFNLDPHIESPERVADRYRDVDDDLGDLRFRSLASAIVEQAGAPDVVALQEIQDDDGAEQTLVVDARRNLHELTEAVSRRGGPRYRSIDVAPEPGADGGQPGGNIRNGFLYDPDRVDLVEGSLRRLGENDPAFLDSRKVLEAAFRHRPTGEVLVVLNVHLASKRHQRGVFFPDRPGFDPRDPVRRAQAEVVRARLLELRAVGRRYYVTGDFNDFEFSETLRAMLGHESVNLAETVPVRRRYDYNHRGRLQVLMHGVVARADGESGRARYEILHGNELLGVKPGELGAKPTDHAYVLAGFEVG